MRHTWGRRQPIRCPRLALRGPSAVGVRHQAGCTPWRTSSLIAQEPPAQRAFFQPPGADSLSSGAVRQELRDGHEAGPPRHFCSIEHVSSAARTARTCLTAPELRAALQLGSTAPSALSRRLLPHPSREGSRVERSCTSLQPYSRVMQREVRRPPSAVGAGYPLSRRPLQGRLHLGTW